MKIFSKPARAGAVETQQIELGDYGEPALLLVLALFLPQIEVSQGLFGEVYFPVVAALKSELCRKWQNRGAPIVLQIPDRLPGCCIELSVRIFRQMVDGLRPQIDGDAPGTSNQQISDAVGLIGKLLTALENCRVEVKDLPAVF
jgi:hypothetical protein